MDKESSNNNTSNTKNNTVLIKKKLNTQWCHTPKVSVKASEASVANMRYRYILKETEQLKISWWPQGTECQYPEKWGDLNIQMCQGGM